MVQISMQAFINWLKEEMEAQDLSQSELARRAGRTRSAINGVLTESKGIGVDLLQDIAVGLKVPVETVYRKIGLLPNNPHIVEKDEEINYLIDRLTPDDKMMVIGIIRTVAERRDKYTVGNKSQIEGKDKYHKIPAIKPRKINREGITPPEVVKG